MGNRAGPLPDRAGCSGNRAGPLPDRAGSLPERAGCLGNRASSTPVLAGSQSPYSLILSSLNAQRSGAQQSGLVLKWGKIDGSQAWKWIGMDMLPLEWSGSAAVSSDCMA
ncbi:hypothetical protein [Sporosarcina sp. A2]|uniref:hypothetical protein n=1 Tax=Sporosarcina sp. A2 TaxID=3393449 RepID=UPI003D7BE4DA